MLATVVRQPGERDDAASTATSRRSRSPSAASSLHEAHGSGHGLAVALATLGQICVRLGDLDRAEDALHRALDVRSPIQFHETTGAVFDTLAQIHLIRGRYDTASEFLGRASDAYGAYGRQTSQWYEWSVRVLGARLALRRGALDEAVALRRRDPRRPARRRSTRCRRR